MVPDRPHTRVVILKNENLKFITFSPKMSVPFPLCRAMGFSDKGISALYCF